MENSINFLHPIDTIKSSTDGKLFHKINGNWTETKNILYKSEYKHPTNEIGNDGDFYAKYYRKYNYILYSEDFDNKPWNKVSCKTNKEDSLSFPYNSPSKLTASEELNSHSLDYIFYNKLKQIYTFSVYVLKNEAENIMLSFGEQNDRYGVKAIFNLNTLESSINEYGETNDIENINCGLQSLNNNVVRVWVTAKFRTTLILKASIKLLNENNEETFLPENDTYGLFINGIQLVESSNPEEYILSNGKYATQLVLDSLYKKENKEWVKTPNNIHYLDEEPSSTTGINGDIACIDSIIGLNPLIKVGSSETVGRWDRPVGVIFYNPYKDKWFVKSKKGEYSLVFKSPKPNYYGAAIAMSLNQQVYQTSNRYGRVRHMKGFNTGGNRNFWIRNTGKTKI